MFQLEYLSRFSASRNGVTGRRRRLGFKQTCLASFTPEGISDEKIKRDLRGREDCIVRTWTFCFIMSYAKVHREVLLQAAASGYMTVFLHDDRVLAIFLNLRACFT